MVICALLTLGCPLGFATRARDFHEHPGASRVVVSAPPEAPRAPLVAAAAPRVLPGESLSMDHLPRAWIVGREMFSVHARGAELRLDAYLDRHPTGAPDGGWAEAPVGTPEMDTAFAQAAFGADRAAVVFVDIRQGVRDSYLTVFDQLHGAMRARVMRRLGHTHANYPSVAFNAASGTFGVLWSHADRATFARFTPDGDPLGEPVVIDGKDFTWSNGVRWVSAGDRWAALVSRAREAQMELLEFDTRGAVTSRALPLGEDARRISECALAWDGARYGMAWSTDRALSAAVLERAGTELRLVRSVDLADRSVWAGSPSIAFDGRRYRIVWTDVVGTVRVHLTTLARDGTLVDSVLFASDPERHLMFPFVSASGTSETDVVVSYQAQRGGGYIAPLSRPTFAR